MSTRREREIKRLVEAEGLSLLSLVRGRHYKAKVRDPDGVTHLLVFAVTPSDHRTDRNTLSARSRSQRRKALEGR